MMCMGRSVLGVVVLVEVFIYGATHLAQEASGKKIADIYWNTTNPIFYFDNRFHIFNVRLMDRVDIVCPRYHHGVPVDHMEHSMIYLVDRRSYESCTLNNTKTAKLVGVCMKPYTAQLITIVFRDFTPSPNGLEFRPNRTYYVISTSNGSRNGLKNDHDGLCRHYNMRLQFVVKPRCRPKTAIPDPVSVLGFDPSFQEHAEESEEFEDCDESDGRVEVPVWPKTPPFGRPPFPYPPRSGENALSSGAARNVRGISLLPGALATVLFVVVYRWMILS